MSQKKRKRPEAVSLNPEKIRDKAILDYIYEVRDTIGVPVSEQFKQAMEFYMAHKNDNFTERNNANIISQTTTPTTHHNQTEKITNDDDVPMLGGFSGFISDSDD